MTVPRPNPKVGNLPDTGRSSARAGRLHSAISRRWRPAAVGSANLVRPRPRHQRGQPLHEHQRAHDRVRGPVAPRCLELELYLPRGVELHAFVGQR
jgi:hypothetical protein